MKSIVKINIDEEYKPVINDIIRMGIIQLMVHLLYNMSNPNTHKLFDITFIETFLYIIIGILFYWLVIRQLINFV